MKRRIRSLFFAAVMLMTTLSAFGVPARAEETAETPARTSQEGPEEPVFSEQATMLDEVRLVGVTTPAIGAEPDPYGITVPEGAHYSLNVNGARWYNHTDGYWLRSGDVFEGGRLYELSVCFVPQNGYGFVDLSRMKFIMDGVSLDDYSITMTTAYNGDLHSYANISVTVYFNRVPPVRFSDVTDPDLFYYDAVYWAGNRGIVTGWADGTFRPLAPCNRASVVTFLWRMGGRPEPEGPAAFSDMTGNPEFDTAISWATGEYIVRGWPDNTFRPWNTCNRASVVTFLWRMEGKPDPEHTAGYYFSDPTGNTEFDQAIGWAYENHIVTGYSDGTFRPWNTCNRLAIVSFLYRYYER
ncbi:MAG: S-layer homology domain-containing protein [Lachnospiraceae bacterium]|nr:S-layer homology domain-containing protein [Lachnospiraceae bacterium]